MTYDFMSFLSEEIVCRLLHPKSKKDPEWNVINHKMSLDTSHLTRISISLLAVDSMGLH